ncbi:MAG: elongation factor Ts [Microgenomates group bacterium]
MVDLEKLKQLRKKTGVSFSLCKKALEETKNNLEEAEKLLLQWGGEKLKDKSERKTKEGAIFSYVHHNKKIASLVEILCETDFVSSNAAFKQLGQDIAMQIASQNPQNNDQLLQQEFIKDPSKKINDLLNEAVLKFGEKIVINRFIRWEI